jgi:hypothetical protein
MSLFASPSCSILHKILNLPFCFPVGVFLYLLTIRSLLVLIRDATPGIHYPERYRIAHGNVPSTLASPYAQHRYAKHDLLDGHPQHRTPNQR